MKYKRKVKTNLFYLAWVIMVAHFCVANSNLQEYSISVVSYIAMLLFASKIFILETYYKLKEILVIGIALIWGALASRAADDMRVLWFVLVLCASKGIDFDRTVQLSFKTMLFCCIVFASMFMLGVSQETLVDSSRGVRHSFGMGHPNMFAAYYTLLVVQYIYLNFDKIKIGKIILLTIGSVIVFGFSKGVTGLITSVSTIIIICILKYFPLKKMNAKLIVIGLIIAVAGLTIIPIIYSNRFALLDTMMTGRLHQANFYYKKYGISLLGNNVNADLNSIYTDNILDIGYTKMLLNNGLVYYAVVVGGYTLTMFKACKDNRRDLVSILGCFMLYMCTENVATYIFMNVTMLLFKDFLFFNKNDKMAWKVARTKRNVILKHSIQKQEYRCEEKK